MPPSVDELAREYVKGDMMRTEWILKGHNSSEAFVAYMAHLIADPRWTVLDWNQAGDRAWILMRMDTTQSPASFIIGVMLALASPFFLFMVLTGVAPVSKGVRGTVGVTFGIGFILFVAAVIYFRKPLLQVGRRIATGV